MLHEFIDRRWVMLSGFILSIGSGIGLYIWPQAWMWVLLPPIAFLGLRLVVKKSLFQRSSSIWALLFASTAAVGGWAAYDETTAWNKFCLVIAAVLFYFMTVEQPAENLKILSGFWFIVGIGIAVYFLLTFDFGVQTVKFQVIHQIGLLWMKIRPNSIDLPSIHPNDVAGICIITSAYGLFFLGELGDNKYTRYGLKLAVLVGLGIILLAVVVSSSRGAFFGLMGATGIWLLWRLLHLWKSPLRDKLLGSFPYLVIVSLLLLGTALLLLPLGLLGSSFSVGGNVSASRMELVRSGLWILRDFPFTGGGLNSFPGLYSQYVLVIPYYSILNSHNIFLDVAIEQGVLGGISFLCIYLLTTKQLLTARMDNRSAQAWVLYLAACISLFTAILHGMVDDYLYGGRGTILALVPAGLAVLVSRHGHAEKLEKISERVLNHSESRGFFPRFSASWLPVLTLITGLAILSSFTWNSIIAQWYANIGSVKMAKIDLANYPENRWYYGNDVDKWSSAENDFRQGLVYQGDNRTSNHKLGLIRLQVRDFIFASDYLLKAYEKDSMNRGVVKNLGYSYVWLGEIDKAKSLLEQIPEASEELNVYVWWWNVHGQPDLAKNAYLLASYLDSQVYPAEIDGEKQK